MFPGLLLALAILFLALFGPVLYWRRRFPELRWHWPEQRLESHEFPEDFEFGVATSAHQIEGGGKNSNWTDWEQTKDHKGRPRIARGQVSGAACDHWHRFREDIALMKELGVRTHRLSLEWSKIEPSPGSFDEVALAHYHEVFDAHREAGIEVAITLHHFTHPSWFEAMGGFERRENVDHFVRFAERVFDEFHRESSLWFTINEPEILAAMGHIVGVFPPGARSVQRAGEVLANLLHAHTAVYEALKSKPAGQSVRIGIVKNIFQMDPYRRWSPLDWWGARAADRLMNERILQYFERGVFELVMPPLVSVRYENAAGPRSLDVVGLNYYSHLTLSAEPWTKARARVRLRPHEVPTDMIFAAYPEGLYRALMEIKRLGVPIYVTENGIADAKDDRRADWIRRYLFALQRAMQDGVDVRGFYYWSLIDNFEWVEGYDMRFGLYEVDYATQARRLRPGGAVYREVVQTRRIPPPRAT